MNCEPFAVNYGLFDRFNMIGNVPYVWTNASQGVLHGIQGFQDLSLAGKWTAHETPAGDGVLRTILVVAVGIRLTNYNPELLPLSIGMGSTRVSWRGTVNYQTNPGWYVNGPTAYTVRSHVKLPVVHVRALDLLGSCRGGVVVSLPERRGGVRQDEGRSVHLRLYGGIHFRSDLEVGKGLLIGPEFSPPPATG